MPMRLNGLMSGMDTESVIQELVAARRTKVDETKKAQTKHQWKQDAWKELNGKLKNLMNKTLNNLRFTTAYSKKKTTVSDNNAVSVITGEAAMNGVQSLTIDKLAKTAYLTGSTVAKQEVVNEDGSTELKDVTALTKLSEMEGMADLTAGGSFQITAGDTAVTMNVDENTTISDVLTKMKDAGLNANFDAKTQRFFISAKESGKDSNFSITADDGSIGAEVLSKLGLTESSGANMTMGQDAEIHLNGAVFTSSDNVFEINGLTFTALSADPTKEIAVTTQNDTDGIYDMIKGFFKEYNEIINQMDKMYNADSAKGYEPLTTEEKDSMSEEEVKEWEKKIKDALLRRDSNLSTVSSGLKTVMMDSVEVNGKKMYLSDFGIATLSYFTAPENERNAYHIDGDEDDTETSGNADKLKTMIANDPETVISFFTGLANNLYSKMNKMSSSVEGYRSFGNFYDDKRMKTDYDDYTSKIKDLEEKLADYEDKWYKKFSAMETALAKLQNNTNAVTNMLGGGM